MIEIFITYSIVIVLLIFSGWISIIGGGVRFLYLGIGFLINIQAYKMLQPLWLVIVLSLIALITAFKLSTSAHKQLEGSFIIPQRIILNMSAYSISAIIGLIFGLIIRFF